MGKIAKDSTLEERSFFDVLRCAFLTEMFKSPHRLMHHPSNASLVQAPLQRIEQPFIPTPTYLCEIRAGKQRPDWLSLHLQSLLDYISYIWLIY
jgi:hypothetical protein